MNVPSFPDTTPASFPRALASFALSSFLSALAEHWKTSSWTQVAVRTLCDTQGSRPLGVCRLWDMGCGLWDTDRKGADFA